MMTVPITGVFRAQGGGAVIIVPADQGEVRAGDVVALDALGCGLKEAVVRDVQRYDRPMSWGIRVAEDVSVAVGAFMGARITIRPGRTA